MSDWNNKKEKRPRKDLVAELSRLTADNENLEYANDFCGKEISRLTARIEQLESEAKSVRDYIEAVYGVPRMRSESSIAALDVLDSRLSKESRINQMKDKRIELLEAVIKHIHWSMGDRRIFSDEARDVICDLCDKALAAVVVIPWWLVINPSEVSDNGQLPDND